MEHVDRFTRSLVRMLQSGTFQQFVSCESGRCAKVEFRLQRHYHVHLGRRHIIVREREVETIRRQRAGRWQWARPTICKVRRIIIDRTTGHILHAPHLGNSQAVSQKPPGRRAGVMKVA